MLEGSGILEKRGKDFVSIGKDVERILAYGFLEDFDRNSLRCWKGGFWKHFGRRLGDGF